MLKMNLFFNFMLVIIFMVIFYMLYNMFYSKINKTKTIETFEDYNEETNDALVLAKKNSSNISFLKDEFDKMNNLNIKQNLDELNKNVKNNTKKIIELTNKIGDASKDVADSAEENINI